MHVRRGYFAALGFVGFLVLALLFGSGQHSASAQDATASPDGRCRHGQLRDGSWHGQAGMPASTSSTPLQTHPLVDVYIDGAKALGDLAFGATSGWVAVPAGEHRSR